MAKLALHARSHGPSHLLVEEKSGILLGNTTISGLEGKERVLEVRLIPVKSGRSGSQNKRSRPRRSRKKTTSK